MKHDRALVRGLYDAPMSGSAIERRSFEIIDREAGPHQFSRPEWEVVRRMIHTTADMGIMTDIRFSPDAIDSAVGALRSGKPLYVDSHMIRSGLSLDRLRAVCPDYGPERVVCHVADEDVSADARAQNLPRSLFAVRKARPILDRGIAVFGNAPAALLELNRMIIEEDLRPAVVIGMPVGFVHVVESKQELMTTGAPHVILTGRRGGSPLAVSVIHALCTVAQWQ
ncbi:MAG: precorrin-8X methylmutase [Thermodesulfobacteriota bacterium]